MGHIRIIFENVKQFKNVILMGNKSKTPEKRARLIQYISSIVLHYIVADAFWSHQEVLKRQLQKKKHRHECECGMVEK